MFARRCRTVFIAIIARAAVTSSLEMAVPTSNSETSRNKKKEIQARAVRTRLLRRSLRVRAVHLSCTVVREWTGQRCAFIAAPLNIGLEVSHNAFSPKMIGPMDWFNGMEGIGRCTVKRIIYCTVLCGIIL